MAEKNKSTANTEVEKSKPTANTEVIKDLPLNSVQTQAVQQLLDVPSGTVITKKEKFKVEDTTALVVIERIAVLKGIDKATAMAAVSELYRKGAANAGSSNSLKVDVLCHVSELHTQRAGGPLILKFRNMTFKKLYASQQAIQM